jgi:hypothetical protein
MSFEYTHEFTNTFAPIHFVDGIQTLFVHSGDGTLWVQPNGGALTTWPGTVVRWVCKEPFSISFKQQGGPPQPLPNLEGEQGNDNMFRCELRPAGTFTGGFGPYYEYTVTVGELTLDPIIIVDKKPA